MKKEKIDQYPYIYAWGKLMGSFDYYIENEMKQAKADNAPKNAIYKDSNGIWRTFDDIRDEGVKLDVQSFVK